MIRILLGRLKCPAVNCTKTWYNTDAGKVAFVKHALNERKHEAEGANLVCGVPGCVYMFPTTAQPDAHWKHIDTHVDVLGNELSLKNNTCRIIGTKSIDKNTCPFKRPVIDCLRLAKLIKGRSFWTCILSQYRKVRYRGLLYM
jgi:hypothetical protein